MIERDIQVKRNVNAPFYFCETCPHIDIEKTTIFTNGEPVLKVFECKNRRMCVYAVDRYLKSRNMD